MELLEKGLEYTLDIVKFYLVFRYFFKVQKREWKWKYILAFFILGIYLIWEMYIYENNLFIYLVFIIAEMGLLFQNNAIKIICISLWLSVVIGAFDKMSRIVIWAFKDTINNSIHITFVSSIITIVVEIILGKIVMKRNGNKIIQMNLRYFIFFLVFGLAYSYIMGYLKLILEVGSLDKYMHLDVIITWLVMYIHMIVLIELAISRDYYKEKEAFNRHLLEILKKQYEYLEKNEKDIKDFRHDIKEHMMSIQEYCETQNYERLKEYIREINGKLHINKKRVTVYNQIVDMILNQYIYQSEDVGVRLNIQGQMSEDCLVAPYDLCVIFVNLLKNGIEAAKKSEKKQIELVVGYEDDIMIIHMKNDYQGERRKKDGEYATTKSDTENHGIGIGNIRKCVEKYRGNLEMREENGKFLTTVIIPIE